MSFATTTFALTHAIPKVTIQTQVAAVAAVVVDETRLDLGLLKQIHQLLLNENRHRPDDERLMQNIKTELQKLNNNRIFKKSRGI